MLEKGVQERELLPQSIKVLRLVGEKRLEPVRYEAEWAYLPCD